MPPSESCSSRWRGRMRARGAARHCSICCAPILAGAGFPDGDARQHSSQRPGSGNETGRAGNCRPAEHVHAALKSPADREAIANTAKHFRLGKSGRSLKSPKTERVTERMREGALIAALQRLAVEHFDVLLITLRRSIRRNQRAVQTRTCSPVRSRVFGNARHCAAVEELERKQLFVYLLEPIT